MIQQQSRLTYFLQFIVISGLLLFGLYLQFYQGVLPCPLCSLQRIAFACIAVFSLITVLAFPLRWCRLLLNTLSLIMAIIGIALAGRQIWLQHFPPVASTECSPSLQYMIQVLPMNELIQEIFAGSAECASKSWEFLTLDMAEWAIIWFILLAGWQLFLLRQDFTNPRKNNTFR